LGKGAKGLNHTLLGKTVIEFATDQRGKKMKVIENYGRAIESSDENLFKELFAPQVRLEIPAGTSGDHPANTVSHILSQVGKTAPGIKCTLTADAANNWHLLVFEGQLEGQKLQAIDQVHSTKMARSITSLSTCVPSRWRRGLRKPSCKDFNLRRP
jgi:hypothetical protein